MELYLLNLRLEKLRTQLFECETEIGRLFHEKRIDSLETVILNTKETLK